MMSVKFIPKPPAHFPAKYKNRVGGTIGIDEYQKNPQLAYKVTASRLDTITMQPVGVVESYVIRMDEIDMLRQEYITHIASAPNSVKKGVKVPKRSQIVLESSLGAGGWGSYTSNGVEDASYPYRYVVNDSMQVLFLNYDIRFGLASKVVPLVDPYAAQRLIDPYTTPAFPATATLAANQTIRVTSAYRNPERQEFYSRATAGRHMLGRALDISLNNIGGYGSQSRGVAFYKAWEVIHRLNADTDATYNPLRKAVSTTTKGASDTVPWADRWALETAGASNILVSSDGAWVTKRYDRVKKKKLRTFYEVDKNKNGVLNGYDYTVHLHIQDNPAEGAHK